MVMRGGAVVETVKDMLTERDHELHRLSEIDEWLNGDAYARKFITQSMQEFTPEKSALRDLSETPLLRLVVEETAQQMIVNGVVLDDGKEARPMWSPWERNGMPSRQSALWEASLGYGYSYLMVLPGLVQFPDGRMGDAAYMRPMSPRSVYARYADPAEDEYPICAIRTMRTGGKAELIRFYDEEAVHYVGREADGELRYIEYKTHGLGVTPIVRFAGSMDLEGRTPGEVEKFKGVAMRHVKTTYDRLLIQHHNSWRIITATGLDEPATEAEARDTKLKIAHDRILTGETGVEFGSLPETQMAGILQASDKDLEMLASVSQTPVWTFNGSQLVNLSADALAEARSTQRNKIRQKKNAMGRGIAQALRLASVIEGRVEDANDFSVSVQWEDVEARSLAQAADGLGKIATMLNVPVELLWDQIPGITPRKAEEWRAYADAHPSADVRLADVYERQLGTSSEV